MMKQFILNMDEKKMSNYLTDTIKLYNKTNQLIVGVNEINN